MQYYSKISLRTRLLNVCRSLFRFAPFEGMLAKLTDGKPADHIFAKLVPPEYTYPPNSWRTVTRENVVYKLNLNYVVDHFIFWGLSDASRTHLLRLVQPNATIVDVGANIGWYTLAFAHQASRGRVIAFEPSRNNFDRLIGHLELNSFSNVEPFNLGVGATESRETIYNVVSTNPGMKRIVKNVASTDTGLSGESIEVISLDFFLANLSPPPEKLDFMKIDVEGFEFAVLQGARKTIEAHRPVMLIELDDSNLKQNGESAESLINFLHNLEYTVVDALTLAAVRPDSLHGCHFDILCTGSR